MKSLSRWLFAAFCSLAGTDSVLAQWVQTSGPGGGHISELVTNGAKLFAGTWNGGVSFSTNNGTSWTSVISGSTNPVVFTVTNGPGVITALTNLTFTNTGPVSVTANQAGDTNWNAAPTVTNTFTVTKAPATVTLYDTNQTYNGTARTITNTTVPSGLTVNITYDGNAWAPTNASFQSFVTALRVLEGEEATEAWLRGLVANDAQIFPRNGAILEAVKYRVISIHQHRLFGDIQIRRFEERKADGPES